MVHVISSLIHVIIIMWWMIKLLKTISLCAVLLEINHWTINVFTPVSHSKQYAHSSCNVMVCHNLIFFTSFRDIYLPLDIQVKILYNNASIDTHTKSIMSKCPRFLFIIIFHEISISRGMIFDRYLGNMGAEASVNFQSDDNAYICLI